jgi:Protein of unknwon function (DUF3310)
MNTDEKPFTKLGVMILSTGATVDDVAPRPLVTESEKAAAHHPSHYGGDVVYEVIKIVEARKLDFNLGNAFKYLARAGRKDPAKEREDLVKALFYLERAFVRGFISEPLTSEDPRVPLAYTTERVLYGLTDMGLSSERLRVLQGILDIDGMGTDVGLAGAILRLREHLGEKA